MADTLKPLAYRVRLFDFDVQVRDVCLFALQASKVSFLCDEPSAKILISAEGVGGGLCRHLVYTSELCALCWHRCNPESRHSLERSSNQGS